MADVAVLGLQVDSRPVAAAKTELTGLAAAAKAAETSTGALESAAKRAGVSIEEMRGRVERASTQGVASIGKAANVAALNLDFMRKALARTVGDINVNDVAVKNGTKGLSAMSFEARNLGYQLVDVTQGALMGQSAFQIFAQQGGQVAQVIATSPGGLGGLLKELGKSFAGLLTPMRLLGTAALVAGAAGYALYSSWKTTALQFDDTSRAIETTVQELRSLESAASVKGISRDDFFKGSESFAKNIYQAKSGLGGLADVFRANNKQAGDFNSSLETAADLIRNAGSDQQRLQLLQQMGLPATMEWVRFLSQGRDGIRQAREEMVRTSPAEQALIDKARQFDEAWNKTWRNFKDGAFGALTAAKGWITDLETGFNRFLFKMNSNEAGARVTAGFNDLGGGNNNPALKSALERRAAQMRGEKPSVDPAAVRAALNAEQQRLSLLGQTTSVGQQVRLVEIQIAQARLNGVSITGREAEQLKELARQRALGIDTIRAQADSYRIEAATVGMSIEQAASYAAVQQRLNEARRNGQTLTAEQVAEIQREGDALGRAAAQADDLRFRYDTFSGVFREFGQNLRNGQNAWDAFRNAGVNALSKIADRLMDMASRNLWNAAFPTGGGGIFGALLGLGGSGPSLQGGVWPAANGHVFNAPGLSAFSGQVVTRPTMFPINDGPIRVQAFAKGAGLMGEAGPEAVMPLTRTPDGKLGVRSSSGNSGPSVIVQQTIHYTFTGVEPGMEARIKRYIDDGDRKAVQKAVEAVPVQRRNSPTTYLSG